MKKAQLKQFDKLWDEEMEKIWESKKVPNFHYIYGMVKRITNKLLESK